RSSDLQTSELTNAVFQAEQGELSGPVSVGQGAVMFQITDVTRFDREKFEAEKATLREDLRMQESRKLRAALLDQRRQEAKIEVNEDVLPPSQRSL
ncbi:MAG: hypothetical protein KY432_09090, partial [Acidobacteria bacterium]|nr:hypothetical protein [Acidobacteriota bacterium]